MGTPTVDYDTPVPCYASHATAASIRQIGWHVAASGATQGLEVRRPFTFAFVPAPFWARALGLNHEQELAFLNQVAVGEFPQPVKALRAGAQVDIVGGLRATDEFALAIGRVSAAWTRTAEVISLPGVRRSRPAWPRPLTCIKPSGPAAWHIGRERTGG